MSSHSTRRSGPPVIFVHGVSLDPRLFARTARHLSQPSDTWTRPGYDGASPASTFDKQVERFIDHLAQVGPCIVAGVSGGATLGLAAAIAQPNEMLGLVTHEPLIGPLETRLHDRIAHSAESLASDGSDAAVDAFLNRLYGEAWAARPLSSKTWSDQHRAHVPIDVGQFALFAPTLEELASIDIRHTTTVGAASAASRHRVAVTLQSAGADAAVIAGSGHLVLIDNPAGFAANIDEVAALIDGRSTER